MTTALHAVRPKIGPAELRHRRTGKSGPAAARRTASVRLAKTDERVAICRACHDARVCPNVTACCGGGMLVVIRVPCPHGRWEIGATNG